MNNYDEPWLKQMLDAALDYGEKPASPDFNAIRRAAQDAPPKSRGFTRSGKILAAAIITAGIAAAVPAAFFGYRAAERRNAVQEENRLFAEQIIGGTIFDEGLCPDTPWPFEDTGTKDFFDI